MKNLKKCLIVVFFIFFWLLWISSADMLIPEQRISVWSQITIKSNCIKLVDLENIAWLKVVKVTKYNMNRPPFWVTYNFVEMPQNQCTIIGGRKNSTFYFYLTRSVKVSWNYEFKKELSYSQFKSLIKKKLDYATLVDINDIIRTEKCDNDHYSTGWYTFEWFWCDPTRRESTEIMYTLKDNWKWWYELIRMVWNNWQEEIVKKLGNINRFVFLKSLLLTILLETFALFFLCKLFFKKDNLKTWKIILTWIIASTVTLPILRFVLPHIFHNYTVYAIVGEVFVTFVEIFIIKYILDINRQKSTIASIACNLFSVIIGLLL